MQTSAGASDAVMACSSMSVGMIGALPLEQSVHDAPQLVGHRRARDQVAIAPVQRFASGRHMHAKKRPLKVQVQEMDGGYDVRSGRHLSARWSGLRRTRVPVSAATGRQALMKSGKRWQQHPPYGLGR
jgi:hypothetical protein